MNNQVQTNSNNTSTVSCKYGEHIQVTYPRLYMVICFTLIASLLVVVTDIAAIMSQDHFVVAQKQPTQVQRSSVLDVDLASECNYFLIKVCW